MVCGRAMPITSREEQQHRREIVAACRRIYERGWLASTDGNVSVRLDETRILTTPTGIHKGFRMTEQDLIVVDRAGRKLAGSGKPSSELRMHLAAYDRRAEVRAVVHAHPTNCIAFSLAGISLAENLLPETVFTLGSIPTTAYTTPTTEEVPAEVSKWLGEFDALVLDRHGSLTVGRDLWEAYDRLERMEHVAEITFRARMLGPVKPLSQEQVARLQGVGASLGLPARRVLGAPGGAGDEGAGARPQGSAEGGDEAMIARIRDRVERELARR